MNHLRKFGRTFIYMFRRVANRIIRDNITLYSAMATFFLVLSSLPFAMIMISALRFLIPDSISPLWTSIMQLMPEEIKVFLLRFINELLHTSNTSIVSLSLLISLWAASKGIMGLELGMHVIYRNSPRGSYLHRRLRCTLYTLIFVLTILIAILMLVFGSTIETILETRISILARVTQLVLGLRVTIMFFIFVVVFTLGYKFLAGTKATFLQRLPGVLFSTIGWIVFSSLFSIYIDNFSNYTYLYGSLGALMLLLLWLYFCMIILLFGAEINVLLRDVSTGRCIIWLDPLDDDAYRSKTEAQVPEILMRDWTISPSDLTESKPDPDSAKHPEETLPAENHMTKETIEETERDEAAG